MKKVLILFSLCLLAASEYTPGDSGGPWTIEELLIVRAKLWSLMIDHRAASNYKNISFNARPMADELDEKWINLGLQFFPAKLLRLGFHDCLKYVDESGGCDGCLNWEGMNTRFPSDQKSIKFKYNYNDITKGNNNGLEYTVALLEMIYTDKDFPKDNAPSLPESLKASGKSRADLWAYASKVAIEYSVERNNFHCEGKPKGDTWSGSTIGNSDDCQRLLDDDPNDPTIIGRCKLILNKEINFKYGRRDCIPANLATPYKASKTETHPNPEGNGDDTLDFFKSEFNFSGQEVVAIMGAHTLGKMTMEHSLYKYSWTSRGGHMFNNVYYRNIVRKEDWFIEAEDNNSCDRIGDANGAKPDIKWVPTMNGFTKSGGPMHWIRTHYSCPNCIHRWTKNQHLNKVWEECCETKPDNKSCLPDYKNHPDKVEDINGCEKYRFATNLDDMTINAEMGLYLKFDQVNGIPVVGEDGSCSGLKKFNMKVWKKNTKNGTIRDKYRRAWDHGCDLNMRREPESDEPVSSYFETYAGNQTRWVEDFIPAFEKMSINGYENSELHDAPSSWENVFCRRTITKKIECSKS